MKFARALAKERWLGGLIAGLLLPGLSVANPLGEVVRHGNVTFERVDGRLQVLQRSNKAIIDWDSFSISAGEVTNFAQPSSRAAALNRVRGAALSRIDGALRSNGRVLLINPNGIVVGPTGTIDVGGFVASTLDIPDGEFLAGGDLNFRGNSPAAVVNLGKISSFDGDLFLIANEVRNEGTLSAPNGTVGLAAGRDVLIKEAGGHERVFVRAGNGRVVNSGDIEGAVAELKAYNGNLYGMAVKNEGRIAATGVQRQGGQIFLKANGGKVRNTGTLQARNADGSGGRIEIDAGEGGSVEAGGTIDAKGDSGTGGEVLILGSEIEVMENALVIADGPAGGGSIHIGGGRRGEDPDLLNADNVTVKPGAVLSANALNSGDGGTVIVFAKDTLRFDGSIEARGGPNGGYGGFAELSGQKDLFVENLTGRIDLTAPGGGSAGTLLIDPDTFVVDGEASGSVGGSPASGTLVDADISEFLETASLIVESTAGGNILLAGDVAIGWEPIAAPTTLTFMSAGNFVMDAGAVIDASLGTGSIDIFAANDVLLNVGSSLMTDSGSIGIEATRSMNLNGAAVSVGSGDLNLAANKTGTQTGGFSGILASTSQLSSADGNILLEGHGGGALTGNRGIQLEGSTVQSTGAGTITLNGTGGAGSAAQQNGIGLFTGSTIAAVDGNISLVGKGGGDGSAGSLDQAGVVIFSGMVETTGAGNIVIEGTGGNGGGAGNDAGVFLSSPVRTTGTGSLKITGISGASPGAEGVLMIGSATLGGAGMSGDITLNTDTLQIDGGAVQSSGKLEILPINPAASIGLGNSANGMLNLDASEIGRLQNGFSSITIGDAIDGSGPITVEALTFQDPITIASPAAGGSITINDNLSAPSITLDGPGATTFLNADLSANGPITISDSVIIGATDVRIDSNSNDITITGDISADSAANDRNLFIDAGTGGVFDFQGTIGNNELIDDLQVRAMDFPFSGLLKTDGGQTHLAPLRLTGDATLEAGGDVSLNEVEGTLPGMQSLTVTTPGAFDAARGIGQNTILDSLTVNADVVVGIQEPISAANNITLNSPAGILLIGNDLTSTGGDLFLSGHGVDLAGQTSAAGSVNVNFGGPGGTTMPTFWARGAGISAGTGLFVAGGPNNDLFLIESAIPSVATYDGGPGDDTLDFNQFGSAINLDAADFSNLETIIGTAFPDTLTGPATATTFDITGLNEFSFNGTDVSDFENVTGGPAADRFHILPGASLDGRIIGGGPVNTLDYSTFGLPVVVDFQNRIGTGLNDGNPGGFADITEFIGSGDPASFFIGPDAPTQYTFDGPNTLTLGAGSVTARDFPNVLGGASDDLFRFAPGGSLDGILEGGGGANGLNYFLFDQPVLVNLQNQMATGIGSVFSNIHSLGGSLGTNTLIGPIFPTRYQIDGINGFNFLNNGTPFTVAGVENLVAGPGSDLFDLLPGGRLDGRLDGVGGDDRLSYEFFGGPVMVNIGTGDATGFGRIFSIERLMGSPRSDTLATAADNDTFNILADNSGNIGGAIRFDSFERLDSGAGDDRFNFLNQATVSFVDGGLGSNDILFLNLDGPAGSLNIREGRIDFNRTWHFGGIEMVEANLGGGADTATTRFTTFQQVLRAGPGFDTLEIVGNPVVTGNRAVGANGKDIVFFDFEDLAFIDPPPSPQPITMEETTEEMEMSEVTPETGTLLQNQAEQPLVNDGGVGNVGGDNGGTPFQNQFTAETLTLSQQSLSSLQSAFSAAVATTGQGVFIAIGADGTGIVFAPYSLDGRGLTPSNLATQALQEALSPLATLELADAIGFDMPIYLFRQEGAQAIDLNQADIDPVILTRLWESLNAGGTVELLDAINQAIIVPVTPEDDSVSIGTGEAAVDQGVIVILNAQIAPEALAELIAALDEPVGN